MEQPLAAVLAKMEIVGIKVERQTLQDMQVETKRSWERPWTQEIYELEEKSSTSILQNNWGHPL